MAFPTTALSITIELALGADLTASPSTWAWTDVTSYVYVRDGLTITRGRADGVKETPASTCEFTANNRDGRWCGSNPTGAWYGQLGKNTPIRVKTGEGTTSVRWTGFLSALPPRWDPSGNDKYVTVKASGILQRLERGITPLRSPITRSVVSNSPVGYWPCEDGSGAVALAEYGGGSPMTWYGGLEPGSIGPGGSSPLPEWTGAAELQGNVTAHAVTGEWHIACVFNFPGSPAAATTILRWHTTGTYPTWQVVLTAGSPDTIALQAFDASGTMQINDSDSFVDGDGVELHDQWLVLDVGVQINGGTNLFYGATVYGDFGGTGFAASIESSISGGRITKFIVPYSVNTVGMYAGHFAAWNEYQSSVPVDPTSLGGFDGDGTGDRIDRLASQLAAIDGSVSLLGYEFFIAMGPQPQDTVTAVLREAEAVDGGRLYEAMDAVDEGAFLVMKFGNVITNQDVDLTVANSSGQLGLPFDPTDDDQYIRNDWTTSRSGNSAGEGSSARYIATAGPLTPTEVGTYDDSVSLNVQTDAQLIHQAGWRVNHGTVPGLRFPTIALNLAASPELIPDWITCDVGDRMQVTSPPAGMSPETLDLLIEGWTESFGPYDWMVELNCSPYLPWRVFTLAPTEAGGAHTTEVPGDLDESAGAATNRGNTYVFSNPGYVTAIKFYVPGTNSGTYTVGLYRVDTDDDPAGSGTGTLLASASVASGSVAASSWATVAITPQRVDTLTAYRAVVHSSSGQYVFTNNTFAADTLSYGDVTCIQDGTDPIGIGTLDNGTFVNNASLTYPTSDGSADDYFVDVLFVSDFLGRLAESPDGPRLRTAINSSATSLDFDPNRTYWTTKLALDNFQRSETNGWGTPDYPASAWVPDVGAASTFSTTAGKGVISIGALADNRRILLPVTHSDIDCTADFLIPTPTGELMPTLFVMRWVDTSNWYYIRVEVSTASAVSMSIRGVLAGVDTELLGSTTISGLTHSSTVPLRVRWSAQGTTLSGKVWLSTADEPGSWHRSTTHTSIASGTRIGLWGILGAGCTNALPVAYQFDRLRAVASPRADVDDFPLNVRLGGEVATVSAISTTRATYVAAGAASHADNAAVTPAMYAGATTNDLIIVFAAIRSSGTGTLATPTGYTRLTDIWPATVNVAVFAKVHDGSEADPTVTPSGGSAGDTVSALTFGLRGMPITLTDLNDMVIQAETLLNASAANIAHSTVYPWGVLNAVQIIFAWKQDDFTSIAIPSGFGTEIEASTTTGSDQSLYVAIRLDTPPTSVASGSLAVTGGAAAISRSAVVSLAGGYQTMTISSRSVNSVTKAQTAGTLIEVEAPGVLGL